MTLTLNTSTCDEITVASTILDDFIAAPASYISLLITATYNNGEAVTRTYTDVSPITGTTDISTNAGVETINPSLFGMTTFSNGVYSFDFLLKSSGQTESEEGCIFVDCIPTGECIGSIKKQIYELDVTDKEFAILAASYDLLSKIGECQCKCDKAYTIYENLIDSLDDCENMLTCNLINELYSIIKAEQFGLGKDKCQDTFFKMYKTHRLEETNCLDFDNHCFVNEVCSGITILTCNLTIEAISVQEDCTTFTASITTI